MIKSSILSKKNTNFTRTRVLRINNSYSRVLRVLRRVLIRTRVLESS